MFRLEQLPDGPCLTAGRDGGVQDGIGIAVAKIEAVAQHAVEAVVPGALEIRQQLPVLDGELLLHFGKAPVDLLPLLAVAGMQRHTGVGQNPLDNVSLKGILRSGGCKELLKARIDPLGESKAEGVRHVFCAQRLRLVQGGPLFFV